MFNYNDGGREDAGYKGKTRDCTVRAMAIALKLPYKQCYEELAQANKEAGGKKSVRGGVTIKVFEAVLNKHGWYWEAAPKFRSRKARAADTYGTVIARQARHVVAVRKGVVQDVINSSGKMVYGIWRKKQK